MTTRQPLAYAIFALGLAIAAPAAAQSDQNDPPARVGRLAQASGSVSFHTADQNEWQAATLNYPVTSGNSFWTEPGAHAAIDVGASRIYLDGSTELDIATLDDQSLVASLAQGVVYLRVPDASNDSQYEIDTPRGAVHITRPGLYQIVAGDTDNPTTVTAFDGSAQIVGQNINTDVAPGEAIYISGQGPFSVSGDTAQQDDFSQFVQNEEQPYIAASRAPAYVSQRETGYQDLGRYGQWQQTPNYGPVWMPRQVAVDWAPYRDGHWAYVVPWGWTWVDDAPWGFTPFHYGRWIQYRDRWAWLPGEVVEQPIYAPALVNFFGGFNFGGGVSISISIGSAVGWVPLGPEEVYVPPYYSSPQYVRNVNITNVHNETTIINVVNNKTIINNYINRNATTVVSADAMANSRQIAAEFKRVPKDQLQQQLTTATPMGTQAPVKPTAATAGVTPEIAKKIGATPPPNGVVLNKPIAPGPVVTTKQVGSNGQGVTGQPPLLKKGKKTATNGNNAGGNAAGTQNGVPGPAIIPNNNAATQNGTGQLPLLKKGKNTATNGNNAGGNATGTQNGVPGPAIIPNNNAATQNGTGQLPLLKQGKSVTTNGNNAGGNAAGTQNGVPGPAIIPNANTAPQMGTGQPPLLKQGKSVTTNGKNASGNATDTQNGVPGPAMIPNDNAAPQIGSGQLPLLKKRKNTATSGNNAGGNATDTQNGVPGPAIIPNDSAAPQIGTGQPPLVKQGKNVTTNGNNADGNATETQGGAPGPTITKTKNIIPQNGTGQPPLLKKGNGTAPNGDQGKTFDPTCNGPDQPKC